MRKITETKNTFSMAIEYFVFGALPRTRAEE
jgi:hypothetical protein